MSESVNVQTFKWVLPNSVSHSWRQYDDAIPATLATLLQQYFSTLALPSTPRLDTMTPAALRDDLLRQADAHVPSTKALRTLVEQLLQDRTVLDAIQRVLDTARMSNAGELSGAAGGTEASTVPHTEAEGKPLDTYAQVLTFVLAKLLAARSDIPSTRL